MKPANDNYLAADVANLVAEIDSLFVAYPELAQDETLKRDMLEGSTAAFDVLSRLVSIERDSDSMAKAIAGRLQELQARKTRAERRKEAMRLLMHRIMRACSIPKAALTEATLSVVKGRQSVEITDEQALPKWAYVLEKKPDKKAIMERLAANKNVKGARLKDGEETIMVRVA